MAGTNLDRKAAREGSSDLRRLHNELQSVALRKMRDGFVDILVHKIKQQGVELSDEDRGQIETFLQSPNNVDILKVSAAGPEHLAIAITPADIEEADAHAQAVLRALTRSIFEIIDGAAADLLESFQKRWPAESASQNRQVVGFRRRLKRYWGSPLATLGCLITICRELGEQFLLHEAGTVNPITTDLLARFHAQACQVAAEILELLRAGFADAAMARWRTLYEVAILADFINEHGELAADRFVDYEAVEAWHAADQYRKHHEALGLPPMEASEYAEVEGRYREVLVKHGEEFRRRSAWATPFLPRLERRDPTFTDIEVAVGSGHWRPYHRLASDRVHANPTGTFYKLGLLGDPTILLAGASHFGLAEPGQLAALSLTRITTAFTLSQEPTIDILAMVKVCGQLSEIAQTQFLEAAESERL
jgi:hypothetical protein